MIPYRNGLRIAGPEVVGTLAPLQAIVGSEGLQAGFAVDAGGGDIVDGIDQRSLATGIVHGQDDFISRRPVNALPASFDLSAIGGLGLGAGRAGTGAETDGPAREILGAGCKGYQAHYYRRNAE